jgi:hypothetical protein
VGGRGGDGRGGGEGAGYGLPEWMREGEGWMDWGLGVGDSLRWGSGMVAWLAE